MKCKSPFYNKDLGILCPCGQCVPCLINRRRGWVTRMILESYAHRESCFLTLTYDKRKFDPLTQSDGNLVPEHLSLFWKRLRKHYFDKKIRYFACGEYGTKTKRPHYHAILWGIDFPTPRDRKKCQDIWGLGNVKYGKAEKDSMQYVAGYTCKKYVGYQDDVKNGKVREFCRMSLKPGIGCLYLPQMKDKALLQNDGLDVIHTILVGDRRFPVPRYIRTKLREMCFDDSYIQDLKDFVIGNMKSEVYQLIRASGYHPFTINEKLKGDYAIQAYDELVRPTVEASIKRNQRKSRRDTL